MLYWYDVLYGGEYFLELCEINKTRWFVWFELHKWNLEVAEKNNVVRMDIVYR